MEFSKIGALCGVAGPLIAYLSIAVSIYLSPWFNWFGNALSDLGVGRAGYIFNMGLILSGLILIPFSLLLWRNMRETRLGRYGALVFLIAAVSLSLIGVFPEKRPFLTIHVVVSLLFFSLTAASSIMIGYTLRKKGVRMLGLVALAAGTVIIGCHIAIIPIVILTYPESAVAIPELVAAVSATIWILIISLKRLTGGSRFSMN